VVVATGDADDLTGALMVGLGAADVHEQSAGLGLEVGNGERRELAGT
jgi:hypothetical protein